ncbi:MAG TPA: ABC transporter permease subunit [Candidatus Limnocylindrales bacterium]
MTAAASELVRAPVRSMRRSIFWWSVGLAGLVATTMAFWPAFSGSSGISEALDQLPPGLVQALGMQAFGTPAGYLRGNLYELFLPLLLTAAAIALMNGQTASEEAHGRLELILAQPVDRRAVFLGRAVAVAVALVVIALVMSAVQLAADAFVGLSIDTGYLLATIFLCALLAALHGALALAVAAVRPRPSLVLGVGVGAAIAGYLIAALLPLSPPLAPWRHLSPWDWALGGDPLEHPTDPWRYLALAVTAGVLVALAMRAVARRDVASA